MREIRPTFGTLRQLARALASCPHYSTRVHSLKDPLPIIRPSDEIMRRGYKISYTPGLTELETRHLVA